MKSRRQALQFYLNAVVIIVVQIMDQFLLEVLHRLECLQIEQFTFQQAKEIFHHGIVETITFAAHALPDALTFEHTLVLLVLVVPALVRMEDKFRLVWFQKPCPASKLPYSGRAAQRSYSLPDSRYADPGWARDTVSGQTG